MPEQEGHKRRTLGEDGFAAPARADYVEFGLASCFSFLRAASDAVDLVETAHHLGYDSIGIADHNTLAGVVRVHVEAEKAHIRPLIGARLVLLCGAELLAYPQDRTAYARLSTLLSAGKMQSVDGEWQQKGETHLTLEMLSQQAEGLHLIVMPPENLDVFAAGLPRLVKALPGMRHVGASFLYRGDDRARINRLDALARAQGAQGIGPEPNPQRRGIGISVRGRMDMMHPQMRRDVVSVKQRNIDRGADSPRQTRGCVDQLMRVGIRDLADKEPKREKQADALDRINEIVRGQRPYAQRQQGEMDHCQRQAEHAARRVCLRGHGARDLIKRKDHHCDEGQRRPNPVAATQAGQRDHECRGQAGGGVPEHWGLSTGIAGFLYLIVCAR